MEFIEGVLKKIKKGNANPVSKKEKNISEVWDYNRFREYLLLLTKGENSLLSIDQYPQAVALSEDWHSLLNKMREDSVDGIERWALIGYKKGKEAIYLPTVAAKGLPYDVSVEGMAESRHKAITQVGITGLLGDIHSHPIALEKENGRKLFIKSPELFEGGVFEVGPSARSFSAGDLYSMFVPGNHKLVMGLVAGDENLFAFRTRETTGLGIGAYFLSQETFEKSWYEKYGFQYFSNVNEFGASGIKQVRPDASNWSVNLGIAETYKLVLYKGDAGKNLVKVFSPSK